jgi:hypothetical protein
MCASMRISPLIGPLDVGDDQRLLCGKVAVACLWATASALVAVN